MPRTASVLVAHGSEEERARLVGALYETGYEAVNAATGVEALRSTAGVNPQLVVAAADLPEIPALEVVARLRATGLRLPPFLILCDEASPPPEERPEGSIHFLQSAGLGLDELVRAIRLLVLAGEVGGEFGESLDVMYGDLTRTSFSDLVHALHRHVITGRLSFGGAGDSVVWLEDGVVVEAVRGDARGRKAFNRLAALPKGTFSLAMEAPACERSIEADLDDLLLEAVEARSRLEETLARLPSLDSRPGVELGDSFFSQEFTPLERQLITAAQATTTFRELIDRVPVPDVEVVELAVSLRERGVLRLSEPADRIHVFTDSTADIEPQEARRAGITVVPVSIIFESEVFKDGVDLDPEGFHRRLRESRTLPVTNPATQGELFEAFRRVITTGDVLGVFCSSKLSKSYANALAAAEDGIEELRDLRRGEHVSAEPRVRVLDSCQASGPLGMLVVFASRLARLGLSFDEVAARVDSISKRLHTVLMVSDIAYLQRAGGVGRGDKLAKAKGAKPRWILTLEGGALGIKERLQAGREANIRLVKLLTEGLDRDRPTIAVIVHASAPALAAELRTTLTGRLEIAELIERQMGPAVTCHVGPGTVGASLFQPTDDELELLEG